jgi:hypothetical protein
MTAEGDPAGVPDGKQDYRRLPPEVRLDETIASVDPEVRPDPFAGRNRDQHRALRDE